MTCLRHSVFRNAKNTKVVLVVLAGLVLLACFPRRNLGILGIMGLISFGKEASDTAVIFGAGQERHHLCCSSEQRWKRT